MKDSNKALFDHLEAHCAKRGQPIPEAGLVRWVSGDGEAQDWLKHVVLEKQLRFGRRRSLLWLSKQDTDLVCLVGFEFDSPLTQSLPIVANAGISVCVLSELLPLPIATPTEIRDIVAAGSQLDPNYLGHNYAAVEQLFPSIRTFETPLALDKEAAARLFLMLSVDECRNGESWIDDHLADDLVTLADLNVSSFPYDAVCLSIFDLDPRSLYMALYRCLEATYAYESCRRLIATLGLNKQWHELAVALDEEVGWHPKEAESLNLVLQYALDDDLQGVCECLGADVPADLCVGAGRAIYRLRNRIVHYSSEGVATSMLEDAVWNQLCQRMVGIVFHVFSHAFGAPP